MGVQTVLTGRMHAGEQELRQFKAEIVEFV